MPRILVVTANADLPPLQLAAELRSIRDGLGEQSSFSIVHEGEPRPRDLIRRLRDDRPDILHFAGHGLDRVDEGLSLTGDDGRKCVLLAKDLAGILENVPAAPRLVVLNACYSEGIAAEILRTVGVVVGATGRIGDDVARRFAGNFYAGLGQSCSVKAAFELARIELKASLFDADNVTLAARKGVDPSALVFYGRPELLAEFTTGRTGKPILGDDGHYELKLWLRGVDQHVESVTFQICHDSFKPKDRFWEVTRPEDSSFLTDDFRSTGDVTLRATAWSRGRGVGVESTLGQALRRRYEGSMTPSMEMSIGKFEDS